MIPYDVSVQRVEHKLSGYVSMFCYHQEMSQMCFMPSISIANLFKNFLSSKLFLKLSSVK